MAPPPLINGLWMNWVDINSNQSAGDWTTQDQSALSTAPYTDLISGSQALSCMALFGVALSKRVTLGGVGTTGPYCTHRDQAVMLVQSANATGELVIPGPIEDIFYDSGQLVNLGDSRVQDWWDAVRAVLGDDTGAPWTQLKKGYRRMVG